MRAVDVDTARDEVEGGEDQTWRSRQNGSWSSVRFLFLATRRSRTGSKTPHAYGTFCVKLSLHSMLKCVMLASL